MSTLVAGVTGEAQQLRAASYRCALDLEPSFFPPAANLAQVLGKLDESRSDRWAIP